MQWVGDALELASLGAMHPDTVALPELGVDVHEIRDTHGADTYSAVFRPTGDGIIDIVAAFRREESSRALTQGRFRLLRKRLRCDDARRTEEA